ncbi:hypothetical protein CEXT_704251 [Caerostris extrusa]|uniref:Uncharacterized protein n=1 Tax=Caerostris extrusa TaxID=172846 RepID=A0AAV4XAJ7_CAEEX|nr:hypothetical protein CEXT_704251 [Caerostris extrusa]
MKGNRLHLKPFLCTPLPLCKRYIQRGRLSSEVIKLSMPYHGSELIENGVFPSKDLKGGEEMQLWAPSSRPRSEPTDAAEKVTCGGPESRPSRQVLITTSEQGMCPST